MDVERLHWNGAPAPKTGRLSASNSAFCSPARVHVSAGRCGPVQAVERRVAAQTQSRPIWTGLLNRCAVLRGRRLDRHTDQTKAGLDPSAQPVRAIAQAPGEQLADKMAGRLGSRREPPREPSALTERQVIRGRSARPQAKSGSVYVSDQTTAHLGPNSGRDFVQNRHE